MRFPSSPTPARKGILSPSLPLVAAIAFTFALAACSDDDDDGSPVQPDRSTVTVAMTDAVNDQVVAFEADVRQITITSNTGSRVFLLRERANVDFTTLESTAEVLGATEVPSGSYNRMDLVLDFAEAQTWLVGQTAEAAVVGVDGAPIAGPVSVQVDFPQGSELVLGGQRNHLLLIDLDLESSLAVDQTANQLTFAPVVFVTLDPVTPKPLTLSGNASQFDDQQRTFTLETRSRTGTAGTGTFPVVTGSATTFAVDGRSQAGPAGFTAFTAGTGANERVGVRGTWNAATRTIVATQIDGGAGTSFGGQDVVVGHVVGRAATAGSDTTLTVLGRSTEETSRNRVFNTNHTVAVRLGQTRVVRPGSTADLDTDDVNVGQRIAAHGELTGTNLDALGGGAVPSVIVLLPTTAVGTAGGPVAGDVATIALERFDQRPVSLFDFTVGGIVEANPAQYRVDVRGIDAGTLASGQLFRATGIVNPVGVTGDADFLATAAGGRRDASRLVDATWSPASAGAFADATANGLVLNLTGSTATVRDRFGETALTPTPAPTVRPGPGRGMFALVNGNVVEHHRDFGPFADAVRLRILAGSTVQRLVAAGNWTETSQELAANSVAVILRQP